MSRDSELVKKSTAAAEKQAGRAFFRRHLQGYELALVTVAMVLSSSLLTLPRASRPSTLPLPQIDRAEAQRRALIERERAERAAATGLPFEVRAVGESVRHYGQSVSQGIDPAHDLDDLRERVNAVETSGKGALLLDLRAVQTEYFLAALERFERKGEPDSELSELAADLLKHARHNGWITSHGRFLADEATRRVLFHLHFADLIAKRGTFPFAPTLDDWRHYYRFLLQYPERELVPVVDAESADDVARVRVVNALSRKDPDYPAFFAKGYLLDRLGDRRAAASQYRAHLGQHESGAYALLARNYLIHTLQGADAE